MGCALRQLLSSIAQHVDFMLPCIDRMQNQGLVLIEPEVQAENDWVKTVHEIGPTTLYPLVDSWYTGTNIPGKVRMFTPYASGVGTYRRVCEDVAANDYRGFRFARTASPREAHRVTH